MQFNNKNHIVIIIGTMLLLTLTLQAVAAEDAYNLSSDMYTDTIQFDGNSVVASVDTLKSTDSNFNLETLKNDEFPNNTVINNNENNKNNDKNNPRESTNPLGIEIKGVDDVIALGNEKSVNISITKTPEVIDAMVGQVISYKITVTNNGVSTVKNVWVKEKLPMGLIFKGYSGDGIYDPINGIWTIGDLNNGDTATLIITVLVNKSGNISNIATVYSDESDIEKTSSLTINAFVGNITVTKFANATVVLNGDELTYIISVSNYGPQTVIGVTAKDILDSSLIFLSSIPNKGHYNESTGLWYIGDLASDETAILVINVRTNGSGSLKNTVSVDIYTNTSSGGSGSITIISEIETQVLPAVKFTVTKTVNATKALNGGLLTYVVTVRNYGPDNATGVIVTEILDSRLILLSYVASKGSYDGTIWNIGDLAIDGIVTLTLYVKINGTGTIVNNVTVETNENITGNNTAKVETNVSPAVNITINKTVNATTAIKGDELTYIITVTNNGPDNANSLNVTDKLDSRLILLSSMTSHGTYDANTGLWIIGNLSNGNTVTLKLVVRIDGKGIIPNTATVYTNETNTGNKSVKVETNVPGNVNVTVTKTVNATNALVGEKLTYIITVYNNGPDDANSVNVIDKLDHRLIFISSTGSAGTYNPSTGLWSIGNLKSGSSVNLTIVVWINGTGTIKNNATVNTSDNNLGNDTFSMVETNVSPAVNITINKTVNATNALNGEELTYIITVQNNGPNDADNINVTDVLDNRLILISNIPSQGTYDSVTGLWNIGNLANGKTVTLKIVVRINGTGTIENKATVHTVEINLGNNSVKVETDVPGFVNISINKTVNATNALNGEELTYIITITNFGPDDASGMYVIDKLNQKLIFISSVASTGTYNPNTGMWNIGNLAKGNSASLKIVVRINGTGTIENKATVYTIETNTGNNSSLVETEVEAVVNISVTKTVNATNALNGEELTYIITVHNNGPYNAVGVNATDLVDSKLIILSTNPSAGAYNPATGFWYIGYLADGDSATLTIKVRINGTGTIQNNVTVYTIEKNLGNNTATVETVVKPLVNITIKKTVNATNALNGEELTYIITVENNGPSSVSNVNVTDILDSKLILISYIPNSGSYNPSTGLWTIGNLAKSETVTLKIVVRINGTGTIENKATIHTTETNTGNNTSTVETVVKPLVNITIKKTVNVTRALNGEELSYFITVTNFGPDDASGVYVIDKLDYRLIFISSTPSKGTYDPITGLWNIENLAKGSTATLKIVVSINGTGTIENKAIVHTIETNTGNNTSLVETEVERVINISITKTVNATDALNSEELNYFITVTNFGPDDASGVYVIDKLDYRLIFISSTPSADTYDPITGLWNIGNLAKGATATLKIVVRINGTGSIQNNVTVYTAEKNLGNNTATVETMVKPLVNITIKKTVNATNALNGEELTYIITVYNNGPDNATNVNVTDILDSKLILISNIASFGSYNPITGLWTIGNLAKGETVSLKIVVRINGTGTIENKATIHTTETNTGNNSSTVETMVEPLVNITINKTVNVTEVLNGEELTYIITVYNNGPDNATNVNITDILDYRLVFLSAVSNLGVFNPLTGLWTIGNLNNGDTAILTLNIRVNGTGTIENNATLYTTEFNIGNNVTGVSVLAFEEILNPDINTNNTNNTNNNSNTSNNNSNNNNNNQSVVNPYGENPDTKNLDNNANNKNNFVSGMKKTGGVAPIFVIILILMSAISYVRTTIINKKDIMKKR